MGHIPVEVLAQRIADATKLVEIGARYQHYKGGKYKVLSVGVQEWNNDLCVIYESQSDPKLTFVRPLSNWLESVDNTPRFRKI